MVEEIRVVIHQGYLGRKRGENVRKIKREENMSCITDAYPRVTLECPKHVDLNYHLLVDRDEKGDVDLRYVSTDDMIVDKFTKNLRRVKFR